MKTPKILTKIKLKNLTWLQASSNYTILNFSDGKCLMSSYSLQVFANIFNSNKFMRVDRSHLVNTDFIASISETGVINLKNHQKLSIPRRRRQHLNNHFPSLFLQYGSKA